MKAKITMTVNVLYNIDADNPQAEVPLLWERLKQIMQDGFQNGMPTEDLGAIVEDYAINIDYERLAEPAVVPEPKPVDDGSSGLTEWRFV